MKSQVEMSHILAVHGLAHRKKKSQTGRMSKDHKSCSKNTMKALGDFALILPFSKEIDGRSKTVGYLDYCLNSQPDSMLGHLSGKVTKKINLMT